MRSNCFPIVAVGGVLFENRRVLLVKRANEPAKGLWAIPGGKVQAGETLNEALIREFREETALEIVSGKQIYQFEPMERDKEGQLIFHYLIIDFLVRRIDGECKAGDDAQEIRWFSRQEVDSEKSMAPATRDLLMLCDEKLWRTDG